MNPAKSARNNLPQELSTVLNDVFEHGAPPDVHQIALERLDSTLQKAKTGLLRYSQLEHTLTGLILVAVRANKLVALNLGISRDIFLENMEKQFGQRPYYVPGGFPQLEEQLRQYLDGQRLAFELDTDLSNLTDFQRQVLAATGQIPRGSVATYQEIAQRIGKPKAARAVGQALGHNPIPIVIPCHRVITSAGTLGGYSGGGGLATKSRLLQLEGVALSC
ncbi:MAG: methylated-DNA--[protein]-cysteine S-methyltransferase [Anaerolineales bacterium]|nr:methylated-DNA--[protein]-cysteine S-methyltransferase [Anaerolineales bacterium]